MRVTCAPLVSCPSSPRVIILYNLISVLGTFGRVTTRKSLINRIGFYSKIFNYVFLRALFEYLFRTPIYTRLFERIRNKSYEINVIIVQNPSVGHCRRINNAFTVALRKLFFHCCWVPSMDEPSSSYDSCFTCIYYYNFFCLSTHLHLLCSLA